MGAEAFQKSGPYCACWVLAGYVQMDPLPGGTGHGAVGSWRRCAVDSEGRLFQQETAGIRKLEGVSVAVAIAMELREVLWFVVGTGHFCLSPGMGACVYV